MALLRATAAGPGAGRALYLIALPVALLGVLPVGYIAYESAAVGWEAATALLFRARVRE
jgi:iron(III) transport system permease protein